MTEVTIQLPEATADRLRADARAVHFTLEAYVAKIAGDAAHPANGEQAEEHPALAIIRRFRERTPEQVAAARDALIARGRPARPLPPGKTLADVVQGQWPGDETDEEIRGILEEMS